MITIISLKELCFQFIGKNSKKLNLKSNYHLPEVKKK